MQSHSKCVKCQNTKIAAKLSRTGESVCIPCFISQIEEIVYQTLKEEFSYLLKSNPDKSPTILGVCISGGKDSTVLASVLNTINIKYTLNLDLKLIGIDEGIKGYRDLSIPCIKFTSEQLNLPLTMLSFEDLYEGYTMDYIAGVVGLNYTCTYCGVFRRQAFERASKKIGCNYIVTGHNADDVAQTLLMNLLRGDKKRLSVSVHSYDGQGK